MSSRQEIQLSKMGEFKPNNFESNKNPENLEQKVVNRAFELIKTNPNFEYVLSINGNLTGRGETIGQQDYHYNQKEGVIEKSFDSNEYAVLDIDTLHTKLTPFVPKFETYNWKRRLDNKEFIHYIYRLAFNGRTENKFTTDHRPGVHISTGLRIPKDKNVLEECGEEKLKEYLQNPHSEEAKKFFGKLFVRCNEEFIPDYWKFFLRERELQNKK